MVLNKKSEGLDKNLSETISTLFSKRICTIIIRCNTSGSYLLSTSLNKRKTLNVNKGMIIAAINVLHINLFNSAGI